MLVDRLIVYMLRDDCPFWLVLVELFVIVGQSIFETIEFEI